MRARARVHPTTIRNTCSHTRACVQVRTRRGAEQPGVRRPRESEPVGGVGEFLVAASRINGAARYLPRLPCLPVAEPATVLSSPRLCPSRAINWTDRRTIFGESPCCPPLPHQWRTTRSIARAPSYSLITGGGSERLVRRRFSKEDLTTSLFAFLHNYR